MSKTHNRGMWEYLESNDGLLERGNEMEITEAKKAYRKLYLLKFKQKQRINKPEFTVSFSNEKGEFSRLEHGAKKHKMTITAFIREATMAYISKTYIVVDKMGLAHIEQLLAQCLNEIQTIVKQKERFSFERQNKYELIEGRIAKLENEISKFISAPLPVDEYVKRAIIKNPTLREQILNILALPHDYQNNDPQNSKL